ncbi:hypothetical protein CULT_1670003 [[Clostridium] ultunense Esp]|uniref:hypothetical protein n=1 Tax=Thermicanus aegyptius TaxID=94009 RepID=UPI0002B6F6C7|nr:hypothetical protein [Thermicanus aegyptius]CCQ94086.1 hypothetical protein CULT_1670003 [[Clostridium] ultunense Esp]
MSLYRRREISLRNGNEVQNQLLRIKKRWEEDEKIFNLLEKDREIERWSYRILVDRLLYRFFFRISKGGSGREGTYES